MTSLSMYFCSSKARFSSNFCQFCRSHPCYHTMQLSTDNIMQYLMTIGGSAVFFAVLQNLTLRRLSMSKSPCSRA